MVKVNYHIAHPITAHPSGSSLNSCLLIVSFQEIIYNIDPLDVAPGSANVVNGFDTRTLAAIRSGKWKLITGVEGYNHQIPDPVANPTDCEFKYSYEVKPL